VCNHLTGFKILVDKKKLTHATLTNLVVSNHTPPLKRRLVASFYYELKGGLFTFYETKKEEILFLTTHRWTPMPFTKKLIQNNIIINFVVSFSFGCLLWSHTIFCCHVNICRFFIIEGQTFFPTKSQHSLTTNSILMAFRVILVVCQFFSDRRSR